MITEALLRRFAPGGDRKRIGVLCGIVGIAANAVICTVKLGLGLFAGSVALTADAMNNLSDAGASLVTLVGFKLAARPADDHHPFGHGRLEYIAGVVLAVLVLAVGLDFLKTSINRLIHPRPVEMATAGLVILFAAAAVKLWLFFFYRTVGKGLGSAVLKASALDSLSDAGVTLMVLLSLFAGRYTSFPVDGCAGVLVAALVLWGGVGVLKDTINPLLGEIPSPEMVQELRERILAQPQILGVHDIILHNYGPDRYFASAHAEVDAAVSPMTIHEVLEAAETDVAKHLPIRLVLHSDPFESSSPAVRIWRGRVEEWVGKLDPVLKVYDFRIVSEAEPHLSFHLLIPRVFRLTPEEVRDGLLRELRRYAPTVVLEIRFVHRFV